MSIGPEMRGGDVSRLAAAATVLAALAIGSGQEQAPKESISHKSQPKIEALKQGDASEVDLVSLHEFSRTHLNQNTSPTPPSPEPTTTTTTTPANLPETSPNEPAGILRSIGGCESAGSPDAPINYLAQNPHSTASGGFQILDSTWNFFDGYSRALDAPPSIQIQKAEELYQEDGTAPWAASESCWG